MSLAPPPIDTPMTLPSGMMTPVWRQWFVELTAAVNAVGGGTSATIVTAALTGAGAQGSMTFSAGGVLTAQTPAT